MITMREEKNNLHGNSSRREERRKRSITQNLFRCTKHTRREPSIYRDFTIVVEKLGEQA